MKKEEVISMLDRFPDDINPEELIDELYLKVKLEKGEQAVARGDVLGQDAVVDRSREWFK